MLGCGAAERGILPIADTLSLRVARSGTKLPAPVAMPWQAEACRPCLQAKYLPKELRRGLPKVCNWQYPSFRLIATLRRKFRWLATVVWGVGGRIVD